VDGGAIYEVQYNFPRKLLRRISSFLIVIAFLGFGIWYVVDFPTRYVPIDLSIPYYLDFLPRWLLDIFMGSIMLAALGVILWSYRSNESAVLHIMPNGVVIERKAKSSRIEFKYLEKIHFVEITPFFSTNRRYRVEFIYPGSRVKRVRMLSKGDFFRIIKDIHAVIPEDLAVDVVAFEYIDSGHGEE